MEGQSPFLSAVYTGISLLIMGLGTGSSGHIYITTPNTFEVLWLPCYVNQVKSGREKGAFPSCDLRTDLIKHLLQPRFIVCKVSSQRPSDVLCLSMSDRAVPF